MTRLLFALLLGSLVAPQLLVAQAHQPASTCGLLVMAHGGADAWNSAVEKAVSPLKNERPTEIAFGMADPTTLGKAVLNLEAAGVDCIFVVRLFMSSKSFLHQTEYLLGLRPDAPSFFIGHGEHGAPDPAPLHTDVEFVISRKGLLDAPELGGVLADRARDLSDESGMESVAVIAHGPGDDDENAEWMQKLDLLSDSIRATGLFSSVATYTLREDWDDKRAAAEQQIRDFVEKRTKTGDRVLVIPFRLFGFGPYAEVLDGLTYFASGKGLLPSLVVTAWIRDQVDQLAAQAGRATPPVGESY